MNEKEAKILIYEYLNFNIDDDVKVLGKDHPYNDSTIGEIQEAFYLLKSIDFF